MDDPVGRLLLGGAGRLRSVEIEYQDRAAFARASELIEADTTWNTHVASGYLDGVEVVLVLVGGPPKYLTGK